MHSNRLLWLPCPMYSSTHKPLYLSSVLFTYSKSSKIYRCWIVWGQDIRVVIIPSLLAIAYLGQSSYLYLISQSQLSPLATWLVVSGETVIIQNQIVTEGFTMTITSLTASMAVNALVTGLIVFKILKVFFEVNSTLVELTLDSTGATNLRHVVFVIIESGMTLFAIQVIRLVLTILPMDWTADYAIVIHEMLNVITRSVHFYFFLFFW